jgi:hypothetical protein
VQSSRTTNQRIVEVLNDPIAKELIWSPIPARVAYTALDRTPRVMPLGFHWNGTEFVTCSVRTRRQSRRWRVTRTWH